MDSKSPFRPPARPGHELRPLVSAATGCAATVAAAAHERSAACRGSALDDIPICVCVAPKCPAAGYMHS